MINVRKHMVHTPPYEKVIREPLPVAQHTIMGEHSNQDQICLAKIVYYIVFCVYRGSYLLWSPVMPIMSYGGGYDLREGCVRPSRSLLTPLGLRSRFGDTLTLISSNLSPKRERGATGVKQVFLLDRNGYDCMAFSMPVPSQLTSPKSAFL